jgi:hypothetical protein
MSCWKLVWGVQIKALRDTTFLTHQMNQN